MLRNYVKIALRSLLKQKSYSTINILGLTVGIASCLLIVMYVVDEFSYDTFHNKVDQIYKVTLERKYPNHSTNYAFIPHSYAEVMQQDFPEVEEVLHMGGPFNDVMVSYEKPGSDPVQFEEDYIMAADSNFFNLFSIALRKGEANSVLKNLNDIVVTEATASRYFGDDDPVGKSLRFFGQDFKVTGICENVPANSHMKFDFLTKWDVRLFGDNQRSNFITFTSHVYLLLKPGSDPKALEAKFPAMVDTYAASQIEADLGTSWEDYKDAGNGYRYFLQALPSIHLDPTNIEGKMKPGGNRNYVYFLICIAALVLIIACINFMNLATARSAERAREVGVRKTMGSAKSQLVLQFLAESVLLSTFATLLSILLVYWLLPYFNQIANKELMLSFSWRLSLGLISLSVFVGFLAGAYPALVLSSFNPVVVMKGNFTGQAKGAWLRNGLVVFQFWISIILIVGTVVVSEQMQFMQNKSLGYDKEQVLVVERAFLLQDTIRINRTETFIEELRRLPEVVSAAGSFSMLGRQNDFFGSQFLPEGSSEILTTKSTAIDDAFANAIGFQFIEGRGYAEETNDSLSIILNESAVKALNILNPVGKKLNQVQRGPNGNVMVPFTIIGVIKDFNFQSLRDEITPLAIHSNETFGGGAGYAYARIKKGETESAMKSIERIWKDMAGNNQPFKFTFLDQDLNSQYQSEKQAGLLFGIFSGLAIIIACVGLFGLSAYTASLRTKEIGIRKVLGASVASVVLMLSKDFTKLVVLAFFIAIPMAWYVMDHWLSSFAYRIQLGFGVFIFAGCITLFISLITVSYQTVKAAIINPVKSLKSE